MRACLAIAFGVCVSCVVAPVVAGRAHASDGPVSQAQPDAVPPVAAFPVGWCIRARSDVFADAKRAGFEYVELALQDVLGLSDQKFDRLAADLDRLGLRALSGYNPVPAELKLVGPEINRARQDAHVALLVRRAARLGLSFLIFNSGGLLACAGRFFTRRGDRSLRYFAI